MNKFPHTYDGLKMHKDHSLTCVEQNGSMVIVCITCNQVLVAVEPTKIQSRTFHPFLKSDTQGGKVRK